MASVGVGTADGPRASRFCAHRDRSTRREDRGRWDPGRRPPHLRACGAGFPASPDLPQFSDLFIWYCASLLLLLEGGIIQWRRVLPPRMRAASNWPQSQW